ncbi:MAG: hypothetical protein M0P39_04170 [Rhodocyclaceae bacterium]|jgi:hypothetical protein|nr:hypothetical protein [Rhodocyclaceae bacterium]
MNVAKLISLLVLAACLHPAVGQEATETEGVQSRANLRFFDSKLFDGKLSEELDGNSNTVVVNVPGRISLNSIPPRIDKWITAVGEQGAVEIKLLEQPAGRTRSLFGLIPDMVVSAIRNWREERMIEPARRYNAVVYYRLDASGEPLIEKIVFNRK